MYSSTQPQHRRSRLLPQGRGIRSPTPATQRGYQIRLHGFPVSRYSDGVENVCMVMDVYEQRSKDEGPQKLAERK